MFVSLLSHFWLIHFFRLRLLYQPYIGLFQAPCVQSHQSKPMSAIAITACEVRVSAADSQTVPTVVTGVSKPLGCRLTLTFTLTSVSLYYFYFYWSLYNYTAHAADILTPTTVVQGVDNHSWGLYCRRCYCIRVCWRRSSLIKKMSLVEIMPLQPKFSFHQHTDSLDDQILVWVAVTIMLSKITDLVSSGWLKPVSRKDRHERIWENSTSLVFVTIDCQTRIWFIRNLMHPVEMAPSNPLACFDSPILPLRSELYIKGTYFNNPRVVALESECVAKYYHYVYHFQ